MYLIKKHNKKSEPLGQLRRTGSCFCRLIRTIFLVHLAIGGLAISVGYGQMFRISGYIENIRGSDLESARTIVTSNFTVDIDRSSGNWYIEDQNYPNRSAWKEKDFVVLQEVYEGGEIAFYHLIPEYSGYPIDLHWDQKMAWFLYLGEEYVRDNEGSGVILPRGDPRNDLYVLSCEISADWIDDNYSSPVEARFLYNRTILDESLDLLSLGEVSDGLLSYRGEQYRRFVESREDGDLVARFWVDEWTEMGEGYIPKIWTYEEFLVPGRRGRILRGVTESVASIEAIKQVEVPDGARVSDMRVRDVDRGIEEITYRMPISGIPVLDDSEILAMIERQSLPGDVRTIVFPEEHDSEAKRSMTLVAIFAVLVLIVVSSLIYFLIYRR